MKFCPLPAKLTAKVTLTLLENVLRRETAVSHPSARQAVIICRPGERNAAEWW